QLRLVLEGRHLDLGAKRELGERNRDFADDVFALSREERVLGDGDHHKEIARRPAADSGLTLAAKLEARAVIDAGRHLDAEVLRDAHPPPASARRARVGDDRALAAALATGLGDREEPLLEPDLPAAPAGGTRARRAAALRTLAGAGVAG